MLHHHHETLILPNPNPAPAPAPLPSVRLHFSLLDLLLDDSDSDSPPPPHDPHHHHLLLAIQRSLQDIIDSAASSSSSSSSRKRKLTAAFFQPTDDFFDAAAHRGAHPPSASLCSSSGDSDDGWAAAGTSSPSTPGGNCPLESQPPRPHSQRIRNVDSASASTPALDSICHPDELSSCSSRADSGGQNQRRVLMRPPEKPGAGHDRRGPRICSEDRSMLSCWRSSSCGTGSVVSQEFGGVAATLGGRCFNPSAGTDIDGAANCRRRNDDELASDATSSFCPLNAFVRAVDGTKKTETAG